MSCLPVKEAALTRISAACSNPAVSPAHTLPTPASPAHTLPNPAHAHALPQVGRAFGFQAFNPNPAAKAGVVHVGDGPPPVMFTPATIFVAGDHLCSLLLRDIMPRDKAPGRLESER